MLVLHNITFTNPCCLLQGRPPQVLSTGLGRWRAKRPTTAKFFFIYVAARNFSFGHFCWAILEKQLFCVFWPFLVFLGVIFTQPCCFRVFLALHMTSTHPRHLPDTLRHHPDTARHPQTPSRHPSDIPIFGLHEATGRKSNIWIPWYLFNCFQLI